MKVNDLKELLLAKNKKLKKDYLNKLKKDELVKELQKLF